MKPVTTLGLTLALVTAGGLAAATLGFAQTATSQTEAAGIAPPDKTMTIWRDPGCGCCDAYADYMEKNGYQVTRLDDRAFDQRSVAAGVPAQGMGCHLAEVDGYYVSGLVPVEIIDRLITERPEIAGITLPGMPGNAPGMAREKTGALKTYAFGAAGISVYSDE